MAIINGDQITVTAEDNGKVVSTGVLAGFNTITAKWNDPSIPRAGTLTFTVDGKSLLGDNAINLDSNSPCIGVADENGAPARLAFCEVTPSGLPAGAAVTLFLR